MTVFFYAVVLALLGTIGFGLFGLLREPGGVGAFLGVMLYGTIGTAMTLILSAAMDLPSLRDVALTFALLTGILGVVLSLRCWPGKSGE